MAFEGCDKACVDCQLITCPLRQEGPSEEIMLDCFYEEKGDCLSCKVESACTRAVKALNEETSLRYGK